MASPVARRSGKEALHAYIETLVTWKMWDKPDTTSGHLKNTTLLVFVFFPSQNAWLRKNYVVATQLFYIFSMVYLGFRWTLFDEDILFRCGSTTNQNFTKHPPELRIEVWCLRLQSAKTRAVGSAVRLVIAGLFPKKNNDWEDQIQESTLKRCSMFGCGILMYKYMWYSYVWISIHNIQLWWRSWTIVMISIPSFQFWDSLWVLSSTFIYHPSLSIRLALL